MIVITGPIESIRVDDFQKNEVFYYAEGEKRTVNGLDDFVKKPNSDPFQYELTLPNDKHPYTVSVTAVQEGPVGLSVYLFGKDNDGTPEAIYALREGCKFSQEDVLTAEITEEGAMNARLGQDKLITVTLTGDQCGFKPITVEASSSGEVLSELTDPKHRYGEVVRFEASVEEGMMFEGWLDANGSVLGTEPILYYFITDETTLTAQYRELGTVGVETPVSTDSVDNTGGGEKPISTGLLIGLIAGGAVLLAGLVLLIVLLAGRKKRTNNRYPLVPDRGEVQIKRAEPAPRGPAAAAPAAQSKSRPMSNRAAAVVAHQGPMAGKAVPIRPGQTITVGRSENSDVVFPSSYLSRTHCKVRFDPSTDKYIVTDLGVNGTYFADKRRLPQGKDVAVEPGTKLLLSGNECTITLK